MFNDLGVVIETLRAQYGIRRVAYVDIDVHHGDGIYYAYEEDADLVFADIHEDGRYLYPGSGREDETGKGAARGSKLNVALKPGSGDAEFLQAWPRVEQHLARFEPEFIVFQCGADGLKYDPPGTPELHAGRACACGEKPARHRCEVLKVDGFRRWRLHPRQSCEGLERSTAGNQLTTCQGASANAVTVPISDASERHELGSVVLMFIVLVGSGPQSHWTIFPPLVTAPVRAISGQGRRM